VKATSLIVSIQRISSLNSMPSKDDELAVDARDVAEVKVAVALADEALLQPTQEDGAAKTYSFSVHARRSATWPRSASLVVSQSISVMFCRASRRMPAGVPWPSRSPRRRWPGESRRRLRPARRCRPRRAAPLEQRGRERVLRKLRHLHRVLDRRAFTVQERGVRFP
jgi:hypothetical protein